MTSAWNRLYGSWGRDRGKVLAGGRSRTLVAQNSLGPVFLLGVHQSTKTSINEGSKCNVDALLEVYCISEG